ncbi:AMP-binding protein [Aquiflexum lacus]|uniref:AMP-binding protein n=1 Tax=Aquiflexum lacus TaxID=2483805 RepID=UPI001894769A|nr:AMP-binding protein [Aquiflexum lacus]
MGKIILENKDYTFDQIKNGQWNEEDPYLHQSFSFCQQWLKGVESFELKTSGSTGKPKKIQVSRKQMEISAAATKAFLNIDSESTLLCCLNTEMVAGKMMLVRAMEWNADLVLVKPKENPLEKLWYESRIDFTAMVPLQVQACLSDETTKPKLKSIRTLIIGGAPSSGSLKEKIVEEDINAYQTFGMTETVSHIALAPITKGELVFETLPGVSIGTDEDGRLWISAGMASEEKLQTNDIVELFNNSQFKWLGRADFTINSGGIKIQPEVLEPQLSPFIINHFGDVPFFVFAKHDEKLGQKLLLILECEIIEASKIKSFQNDLRANLINYLVPKEVLVLDKFTRTESGKINRLETIKSL